MAEPAYAKINEAGALGDQLAAIIDAGACASEPTTVIDLTPMDGGDEPIVLREGLGSLAKLGL